MDERIIERLDTIITLLRALLKQQGAPENKDKQITIGPFLGDGTTYRVHPGESAAPRNE